MLPYLRANMLAYLESRQPELHVPVYPSPSAPCRAKQWDDDTAEELGLLPWSRHYLLSWTAVKLALGPGEALAASSQALCLGTQAASASAHRRAAHDRPMNCPPTDSLGLCCPFRTTENGSNHSSHLLPKKEALDSKTLM